MHHCIAEGLHEKAALTVEMATLQDDEHGLTEAGWHKPMCSALPGSLARRDPLL